MYLPVEKMNKNSRVWIYTSSREFSNNEINFLNKELEEFTQNWLSHGDEVMASFKILYNNFIVLIADETSGKTGGCSIDSSFQFIKKLEIELNLSLLNRQIILFKFEDKIEQIPFNNLKNELKIINNKDCKIFFNTLVQNLEELENNFLIEPQNSWIKNHLN